jgi:hypothetical protein
VISPYMYSAGIEFEESTLKAVVVKRLRSVCTPHCTLEFDMLPGHGTILGNFETALENLSGVLPRDCDITPLFVVLPVDHVVECTVRIPLKSEFNNVEWENWEISHHTADSDEVHCLDSVSESLSPCGNFEVRKARVVRRSFVRFLIDSALKHRLYIERIMTPHTVLGNIFARYSAKRGATDADCVYIGSGFVYVFRTSGGKVMTLSSARTNGQDSTERVGDTIRTILSWNRSTYPGANDRLMFDTADNVGLADMLSDELNFRPSDISRLARIIGHSLDAPERYVVPLSALGVA